MAFADFIMPCLEYYPEKRISAQKLLEHPWFKMPSNFDYVMSEIEYQKMVMIKQNTRRERIVDEENKLDVVESDFDMNKADSEDNDERAVGEDNDLYWSGGEDNDRTDTVDIPNYNNSFAAYGQHINLSSCDRANPQFESYL